MWDYVAVYRRYETKGLTKINDKQLGTVEERKYCLQVLVMIPASARPRLQQKLGWLSCVHVHRSYVPRAMEDDSSGKGETS